MSLSVELPRLDEGKFEGALFRGEEGWRLHFRAYFVHMGCGR
ncbi:hypothetical protein FOPG_12584 [Fusarium oxysporum f. sp. conglutinans race 2 54008]|uniref:Uncharacterized protein n=1 Tax=Fusarium oxysporum f. sp. conglutinans race 2 54008 TaxID=1089457 RepID=X0HJ21_FUSOX|nr:hypothetical protein FOPG_12584 [Fusarium oxysporum f. sp. conglutinans race 2 54008]